MASPTKILLVTDLYPHHPEEPLSARSRALHYFVRQWAARPDIDVEVVVPVRYHYRGLWRLPRWRETWWLDGVSVTVVRVWHLPRSTAALSVSNIHRHLDKSGFSPDVIVSHMPIGTRCAVLLNRQLKRPHVCGLHISDVVWMRQGYGHYFEAQAFAYRSRSVRSKARAVLALPRGFLAESGISEDEILPDAEYLARRLHSPLRIVTVCRLLRRKHVDAVLRTLAGLPASLAWTYDVVGDGVHLSELQDQARRLGISDRVTFHRERDRRYCLQAMDRADVFVMISSFETFGLAYLEAMAKGAIVIGSRSTGIDGVIVHGENGFLCEAGDADELSGILLDLTSRDLTSIRRRSLETIHRYTAEVRSTAYLDYILSVANAEIPARIGR